MAAALYLKLLVQWESDFIAREVIVFYYLSCLFKM